MPHSEKHFHAKGAFTRLTGTSLREYPLVFRRQYWQGYCFCEMLYPGISPDEIARRVLETMKAVEPVDERDSRRGI